MNRTVLQQIADSVQARLRARQAGLPSDELRRRAGHARVPHDFVGAFSGPGPHVIAEIKFASPSEGSIADARKTPPTQVAREYLGAGATALSILTEQDYFRGSSGYLAAVRAEFPEARLLMKDFVLEEYQLWEARVMGADAALLIVALLGADRTGRLLEECRRLGLTALVEVHDEAELDVALRSGAVLVGINNRSLKTLDVSLDVSRRLAAHAADSGRVLVSESGIGRASELRELGGLGFSGFLIGTSFMRSGTPGASLERLLREARGDAS